MYRNLAVVLSNVLVRLQFVSYTEPGRHLNSSTRRLIRRHAMKEIGKSRRRKQYNESVATVATAETNDPPFVEEGTTAFINSHVEEVPEDEWMEFPHTASLGSISRRWAGRADYFQQYPIKMNSRLYGLMDHVYDNSVDKFRACRELWLPVLLADPASFHQVLSLASMNMDILRGEKQIRPESAAHHGVAIKSVNNRIIHPVLGVTDGVMGAVASFACYSLMLQNITQWGIHIAGIQKMIDLRGGIESIKPNSSLRLVLMWVDISGSCAQDITPHFPLPYDLLPRINPQPTYSSGAPESARAWATIFRHKPNFIEAFTDFSDLFTLLGRRTREKDFWNERMFVCLYLFPITHKLLALPRLDTSGSGADHKEHLIVEACRLAALLCLNSVKFRFGVYIISMETQITRLLAILQLKKRKNQPSWKPFEILRLWVVLLAWIYCTRYSYGASLPNSSPCEWLTQEIVELCRALYLKSTNDVLMAFSNLRLPWNDDIFSVQYDALHKLLDLS
ncbi:hypothetical protein F5884DRAFT_151973 [Xylogone sp. PMI_703]|nr:hypothetical protein F5884DRAFT_151973 [Xylogone sp. PMI_703]